jgi:hypothetical protein
LLSLRIEVSHPLDDEPRRVALVAVVVADGQGGAFAELDSEPLISTSACASRYELFMSETILRSRSSTKRPYP